MMISLLAFMAPRRTATLWLHHCLRQAMRALKQTLQNPVGHGLTASLLLSALLSFAPLAAFAQSERLPIPALSSRVIDSTQTLSAADKQRIEAQLADIDARTGAQIVVLMVPTTRPETIEAYANRVGQAWKIGDAKEGKGLVFVIAKDDRTMRMEVARGLEGAIPDIAAARIIDNAVVPQLRQGDYAAGIEAALHELDARIGANGRLAASGEAGHSAAAPETAKSATGEPQHAWWDSNVLLIGLLLFFIVLYYVLQFFRRLLGTPLTLLLAGGVSGFGVYWIFSSALFAFIACALVCLMILGVISPSTLAAVASSSSRGGSGGSSRSGGGFKSGGGGSFGGGGASGRW